MNKPAQSPALRAAFRPTFTSPRADGWTAERQSAFIAALSEGGCVEEACAAVGLSPQSAYRLRMKLEARAFRLAWDAAIDLGIRRLTDVCLSRAIHGVAEPRFYQGEQVGEVRRYDHRLAMFLLRYRDPLRYQADYRELAHRLPPEIAMKDLVKAVGQMEVEAAKAASAEAALMPSEEQQRPRAKVARRPRRAPKATGSDRDPGTP